MSSFARRLERTADHIPDRFDPWYFGIPHLDGVVKGVRAGFVNLVIARSHVGKTHVVVTGIRNNPSVPTLFFSADDDPDLVVRKMMFFDGLYPSVDAAWAATRAEMSEYVSREYPSLDVVDNVTWGPVAHNGKISVIDAIERFDADFGEPPRLLVYDYLGIDGNDFQTAMNVASWQKDLTKILPMPVITIAQSNRASTKYEKGQDGAMIRRGFRMEDLSYGGEQQAGLMIGLTAAQSHVAGKPQSVIEVDVVKNKAVFDGSGLTIPTSPIVLCHSNGRLTDRATAQLEWMAETQAMEEVARHEFNHHDL